MNIMTNNKSKSCIIDRMVTVLTLPIYQVGQSVTNFERFEARRKGNVNELYLLLGYV